MMTKKYLILGFLAALLLSSFPLLAQEAQGKQGVVVIVNKNNPASSLSLEDLRRIFKGRKKAWDGGGSITTFLPPSGSDPMRALISSVLHLKNEDELSKFYLILVFQQKLAGIPAATKTGLETAEKIRFHKGGIALVQASDAKNMSDVKVIPVDGL